MLSLRRVFCDRTKSIFKILNKTLNRTDFPLLVGFTEIYSDIATMAVF